MFGEFVFRFIYMVFGSFYFLIWRFVSFYDMEIGDLRAKVRVYIRCFLDIFVYFFC